MRLPPNGSAGGTAPSCLNRLNGRGMAFPLRLRAIAFELAQRRVSSPEGPTADEEFAVPLSVERGEVPPALCLADPFSSSDRTGLQSSGGSIGFW